MSTIPYIITAKNYTFFLEGNPITIHTQDPRYNEVIEAINSGDMEALASILRDNKEAYLLSKISEETEYFNDLKFTVTRDAAGTVVNTLVQFKGQELPKVLQDKLIGLYKAGAKDLKHLVNFVDNLLANPNEHSKEQLYSFLEHKHMPITENGTFIAYKAVMADNYSVHGNNKTHVIQGTVNTRGQILNNPGDVIAIRFDDVENNPQVGCAQGLHVGSYEYASGFKPSNGKIMAVEVNPKHVVSVPFDSACQKCRVSQYKVLNPVEHHFTSLTAEITEDNNVEESDLDESNAEVEIKNRAQVDGIANFAESFIDLISLPENYNEYRHVKGGLSTIARHNSVIFDLKTGNCMTAPAYIEPIAAPNVKIMPRTVSVTTAWKMLRYSFATLSYEAYSSENRPTYTASKYWERVWDELEEKYQDMQADEEFDEYQDELEDEDTDEDDREVTKTGIMQDLMVNWLDEHVESVITELALMRMIMHFNYDVTNLKTWNDKSSMWVYTVK